MKKIIFLILMIFPFLLSAQGINFTDGKCVKGDCKNGNCEYVFNNGDRYSGDFSNEKFNGQGKYTYKSGAVYDGSYRNHQKNGKGVYTYSQSSNKLKYAGNFSQGKFHGYGTLTYKDGRIEDGLWENDVFLGAKIGVYQNKDVLKKGDTIIATANNKKYLLSKQMVAGDTGFAYQLGEYVPKGSFIIETDLQGQKNAIGYITTEGEVPSLSLYGAIEKYAKSSKGHRFYEKKKMTQPRGVPIGKYGNEIVYKSNDSIIMGKKTYLLPLQPFQNSSDNSNRLKRFFIIYEGNNVKFAKPDEAPYHNTKSFIGWVDYKNNRVYVN